jgi:AcrR family transcriptional regulator
MNKETNKEESTPAKRTRRTQQRTQAARNNLMAATTPMFAEQGFDAKSVRDIETAAKVQRGMLAYHFVSKDELWKAVADSMFKALLAALEQRLVITKDLSKREGVVFLVRFHVRYYAEHPELSLLMSR